ncbi:MAG: glycoside hydrolase family 140 protein [Verrucomicrobiota bacterium]
MKTPRIPSLLLMALLVWNPVWAGQAAPRLKVSDNKRFLVYEDGRPFFYLGDTAWELFHRLNREEASRYLEHRAKNGFTVIQAVALAEIDGHTVPNPYGHLPLLDLDPAKPDVKDGPANDYWDQVDYIVNKAETLGLFIGFLPTWGRYWHDNVHEGKPLFTEANAEIYGAWLGRRYKDKPIIWILGGDRGVDNDGFKAVLRAMASGLRKGDGGAHLMTLHPPGGNGSSTWFHNDDWLDFNMRQNGHVAEFTGHYDQTRADYDRTPVKPVLDGEPIYEDHPVSFDAKKLGHSNAADVRRPLYWDLFSGACGHTYGHHSVWQMWAPPRGPINNPLLPWFEAIDQPGAGQMQFGRRLIESRPFLTRIPDDSVLVTDRVPTSVPGAGRYRFVATRDKSGSCAMVYAPIGRKFKVRMDKISGSTVKAWWFNPRNGEATAIGEFPNTGEREFTPPYPGEHLDWVLVLDDASKGFPEPGQPLKP